MFDISRTGRTFTMSRKSLSRRSLVGRGAALGAGASLTGALGKAAAQSTPGASPVASPAASPESQAAAAASDAVIQEIQATSGKRLRILSAVVGGKTPEEDALFAQEIQRLTNVEVELVHPTADYDEKLLADLSAGVEYDLIYMNKNQMDVLVDQGVLTDLTEQINGSELLMNPTVIPTEEWELIRYPEDRFYSVFNKFEGSRMLTVRQDWLDKLGLETPQTLDDVYNVMVAFRDQDPDGNGQADTYGLSTAAIYDIQPFMSSAGVKPGYIEVDGARTIPYATEAAIPVYEWLARLYAEGLYDPNFATNETADMRNMFLTNRVGFVTYWDTWVGLFNSTRQTEDPATEFVAKGIAAVAGPDGSIILNRGQPSVWTIPTNAPDPETAFLFLEWWNTIPGITLGSLGILNHDYTVTDGTYALTDVGREHNMDHGNPTPYNTNWDNPIGELPGLAEAQEISVEYGYLATLGPDFTPEVEPILEEFIVRAILGEISTADAVTGMQEQLLGQGLID
jgi:putative aldouronate transport system substrate-binding protein